MLVSQVSHVTSSGDITHTIRNTSHVNPYSLSYTTDCLWTTRAQEGWGLSGIMEPTWWWHNTAHVYSAAPSVLCSLYRCTLHNTLVPHVTCQAEGAEVPDTLRWLWNITNQTSTSTHWITRTGQQKLCQKPNITRKRLMAVGWWQGLINWSTFAASPVNAEAIKWILIQNYPQSWAHVMWLFNSYRRLKVCLLQHV